MERTSFLKTLFHGPFQKLLQSVKISPDVENGNGLFMKAQLLQGENFKNSSRVPMPPGAMTKPWERCSIISLRWRMVSVRWSVVQLGYSTPSWLKKLGATPNIWPPVWAAPRAQAPSRRYFHRQRPGRSRLSPGSGPADGLPGESLYGFADWRRRIRKCSYGMLLSAPWFRKRCGRVRGRKLFFQPDDPVPGPQLISTVGKEGPAYKANGFVRNQWKPHCRW